MHVPANRELYWLAEAFDVKKATLLNRGKLTIMFAERLLKSHHRARLLSLLNRDIATNGARPDVDPEILARVKKIAGIVL